MKFNKEKSVAVIRRCARFFGAILTVALMVHAVAFSQSSAVNLGTAGNYVILAKTGITTTGATAVTGDLGISPGAASLITGFGLIADATNVFATSSLVTGKVYASDYAPPTPTNMTTAISDMQAAYTDAAGRTSPDSTELGAGDITGKTIPHGLYKWGTGVLISAGGVTISGSATDIWIFQIASDLTVANGAIVTLTGGAQASNIFWQVAGQVTIGTTAQMKGNILSQTQIALGNGATLNGRALAQTAVTLNANTVVKPTAVVAVPAVPVLVAPINAAVSQRTDTLKFVWKSAATATGYNFQLSTSLGFDSFTKNDSTTDTTKKVISISHLTKYYWRVRAYNNGGFSAFSTADSLTTIVPASATPVAISPSGSTNVQRKTTFKWHASTYATKYRLQVASSNLVDSIGGFKAANVVFDSTTTDTVKQLSASLAANTIYYWHVDASDTGGTSDYSSALSFTTIVAVPASPLTISPSGTTNVQRIATFKWHASAYAAKYHLEIASSNAVDSIGGFKAANVVFDTLTADTMKQLSLPLASSTTYYWHVNASDTAGTSDYSTAPNFTTGTLLLVGEPNAGPAKFDLSQNYPNPFNPSTKINYSLQQAELVTLRVYNELGQEVATLVNGRQEAGSYSVTFNAGNGTRSLSSGVYFYRLNAGSFVSTKKLILMK